MFLLTSAVVILHFCSNIAENIVINSNCTIAKNHFGLAVSNFTYCAVINSHPIKVCQECVGTYIAVLETYTNLTQTTDSNGTSCHNQYISLDRLEIIEKMYTNAQNLWSMGKCNECFVTDNGTLTPKQSNTTIKFYDLYQNAAECIKKESIQNGTGICKNCMDVYIALSDYYESISDENEEIAMCMDIVDLMNGTRTAWSDTCCKYRHHSEYIFIISTSLVLLITVFFYALTKMLIDKKLAVVFSQSRFAESLSRSFKH